jgi:thymidylate synthase (FAD)
VTFVIPPWVSVEEGEVSQNVSVLEAGMNWTGDAADRTWFCSCWWAEENYMRLLEAGWTPQQARSVLPNSLKTEIVMTMNMREWRHFFRLRASKAAHPQMQEIAYPMLRIFASRFVPFFEDIDKD